MAVVLVTGASRGIGLELVRQYLAKGATVIGTVRTPSPDLDALKCAALTVVAGVDVAEESGRATLVAALEGSPQLTIVVHNAGIIERDTIATLTAEPVMRCFIVNAVAPILLTRALLEAGRCADGVKLAYITSRMGSVGDNGSGEYYAYRMSKSALNAGCMSLHRDLAKAHPRPWPTGAMVTILHPGMVKTRMTGWEGIPEEESVRGLVARIDELTPATAGKFLHQNGTELPW